MNQEDIKKLKIKVLFIFFIVIFTVAGLRTIDDISIHDDMLEQKQELLAKQVDFLYRDELNKVQDAFLARGGYLAKDKRVHNFIKNRDRDSLYKLAKGRYDTLKSTFPTFTNLHFHLPNNKSFLRVHKKEKYGDNLKDIRPMVTKAIKTKSLVYGFEHGLHDNGRLTYRVAIPILDQNEFLGVVEFGIDFSYINKKIEEHITSMYHSNFHITEMIDKNIINLKEDSYFSEKFKNYKYKDENSKFNNIIKHLISQNYKEHIHYKDSVYYIAWDRIFLKDGFGNNIGTLCYIFDISKDDQLMVSSVKSSIIKPIIVLIIMLFFVNWLFDYFSKQLLELSKQIRKILDTQDSMILLTNGKKIVECNSVLLEFFGFKTLKEFTAKHDCVCDYFIKGDGLLQKEMNGQNWAEYILDNPGQIHKVRMEDCNNSEHIFAISANVYSNKNENSDQHEVITITDITNLESLNKQLAQHSKQASLGEMIGNIAHQWRQPLSSITTAASGMQLEKEYGMLSDEVFNSGTELIIKNSEYLSQTIDDFRDFVKNDKKKTNFNICEVIDQSLMILKPIFNANNIVIVNGECNMIKINTYKNELLQVLINIFNNSKDALKNADINKRIIFIEIDTDNINELVRITIKDTANGIPDEILSKIFDPYFTTKHKSQGTGLGLYMSHQIIYDSMDGVLKASNVEFEYNTKKYSGAMFTIELPL